MKMTKLMMDPKTHICLTTTIWYARIKKQNKGTGYLNQLYLESIFNGFSATESREVSLNGNVYDFSVDYNSIDKSDILNIQKNLMKKNNIK